MINQSISNSNDGFDVRNFLNNHLEAANVKNYGAVADGSTDDSTSIQNAVDNNDVVIIGQKDETFLLSKPINLNSGNRIIINGTVKVQDANIRDLTSDASSGQPTISVANASDYFEAGQWVCVSDDDRPLAGGGIGGNRDHNTGDGLKILSVTSTTITFTTNLLYSYTTDANAKVGHLQSCFIADTVSDVAIFGNGTIDGNRANQYNIEPIEIDASEELRAGCCIVAESSSDVKIDGLTLKDGGLHNLCLRTVDNFRITNIYSYNAHDKSVLLFDATNGFCENIFAKDSIYEDGVLLYAQNERIILNNIRCIDNPRYGFDVNASSKYITVTNCQCEGNGIDLATGDSSFITITNMNIYGDGTNHVQVVGSQYVIFNNLTIDCSEGTSNMSVAGDSTDICLNGGYIAESESAAGEGIGLVMGVSGGNYPSRVFVDNFMFRNCKVAQNIDANCTDIYFSDCKFFDNTSNGGTANATYTDCIGL
jgi:polygalacturonase